MPDVLSDVKGTTFRNASINAVSRDQTNVFQIFSRTARLRSRSVLSEDDYEETRRGQKEPPFSNFRTVLLGDLFLTGMHLPSPTDTMRMFDAQVASTPGFTGFTALVYSQDARESWREDYCFYAKFRHPNVLQLFGINNSIPALIFHSELISLSDLLYRCSPIALCYLQHRWIIDRSQAAHITDSLVRNNELWMQYRSGLLCWGPVGPTVRHKDALDVTERCHHGITQTWTPQLPAEDYTDETAVFRYIEKYLRDFHGFVGQYRTPPTRSTWSSIDSFPSYRLGSVFDTSAGVHIAHVEVPKEHIKGVWDSNSVELENRWTRYSFSPGIFSEPFQLSCTFHTSKQFATMVRTAWLSQAHTLEHHVNLSDCVLLDHVSFAFTFTFDSEVYFDRPLYLFVPPLVDSDEEDGLALNPHSISPRSLLQYFYWCFDPDGDKFELRDMMTLEQLRYPELSVSGGSQWKQYQYDAIKRFQHLANYDSSFIRIPGMPELNILRPQMKRADDSEITVVEESSLSMNPLMIEIEKISDSPTPQLDEPQAPSEDSSSPQTCSQEMTVDTTMQEEISSSVTRGVSIVHVEANDIEFKDEVSKLMGVGELLQDEFFRSLSQEVTIQEMTDHNSEMDQFEDLGELNLEGFFEEVTYEIDY